MDVWMEELLSLPHWKFIVLCTMTIKGILFYSYMHRFKTHDLFILTNIFIFSYIPSRNNAKPNLFGNIVFSLCRGNAGAHLHTHELPWLPVNVMFNGFVLLDCLLLKKICVVCFFELVYIIPACCFVFVIVHHPVIDRYIFIPPDIFAGYFSSLAIH